MALLGLFLPLLPTFLVQLVGAYSTKLKAQADQIINDRNAKRDERVARTNAARDIQVAEGGRSILNPLMRFYIAAGPATYIFKIFMIDKLVCPALGGRCTTDPLSPELWQVVTAVIGFYFVCELTIGSTRAIAGAITRRKS